MDSESIKKEKIPVDIVIKNDLNLNENTYGFVTQVNGIYNTHKDIFLVEKDCLKHDGTIEPSDISDKNIYRSDNGLKNVKSFSKEFDFVIPALNSQTNSFISAHKQFNNFKEESKKSFDLFPDIQIEKAKFNTKNMFDRNVYVRYLTKKVQSEIRSKKQLDVSKNARDTEKIFKVEKSAKLKNNSFNYELSSNETLADQDEKHFENQGDGKYPSIIMPIKPSFKIKVDTKLKQKIEPKIGNNRQRILNHNRSMSLRDGKAKTNRSESRHTEKFKLNENKSGRKIIDLNLISNESIVSSHYMNQPVRKFADLKLNENWPSSNMYKFTIQSNPWVRSFKEKSIANEINTNFRHLSMDGLKKTDLFDYLPSRSENKTSSPFFPNIKQISF